MVSYHDFNTCHLQELQAERGVAAYRTFPPETAAKESSPVKGSEADLAFVSSPGACYRKA